VFLQRPKELDISGLLAARNVVQESQRELKKDEFEEFEFPMDIDELTGKSSLPSDDVAVFETCESELHTLLLRDGLVPSFHNTVTLSCLTVLDSDLGIPSVAN
jgi:hypothetical protein